MGEDARGPARVALILAATLVGACADGGAARPSPTPATEATATALATSTTFPPATQPTAAAPTASAITIPTTVAADEISLSVTSPVSRGQVAIATAKTVAYAECTITVAYSSGPSTARGLDPKAADGEGRVSWSWTVATSTIPGSWPVEVSCSTPSGIRAVARQFLTVR